MRDGVSTRERERELIIRELTIQNGKLRRAVEAAVVVLDEISRLDWSVDRLSISKLARDTLGKINETL